MIQLVARGQEDIYLTDKPQVTFFKVVYRRHTNFATETIPQRPDGPVAFGEKVTCRLSKAGDMVGKVVVQVDLPAIPRFVTDGEVDQLKKVAWVRHVGYRLIKAVSVEIDNKTIDTHLGEWMYIWSHLTRGPIDKMIGNVPALYQFTNGKSGYRLWIPLEFWFCRHTSLAIPIVALTNSEVTITLHFNRAEDCYRLSPTHSSTVTEDLVPFQEGDSVMQGDNRIDVARYDFAAERLYYQRQTPVTAGRVTSQWGSFSIEAERAERISVPPLSLQAILHVEYIYLDAEERTALTAPQEYIIEQVQTSTVRSIVGSQVSHRLSLSHPCKAVYWRAVDADGSNLVSTAQLSIDGYQQPNRSSMFYSAVTVNRHHTGAFDSTIHLHSFSLFPERYQPSSTLNASHINDLRLSLTLEPRHAPATLNVYVLSYNVIRYCMGMGGLAFV